VGFGAVCILHHRTKGQIERNSNSAEKRPAVTLLCALLAEMF